MIKMAKKFNYGVLVSTLIYIELYQRGLLECGGYDYYRYMKNPRDKKELEESRTSWKRNMNLYIEEANEIYKGENNG